MKQKYPFLFALIFSCLFASSQTTFQVEYSYGFSIPIMSNIIQNPVGNYVMTGTNGTFPVHGIIAQIDTNANVVWSYRYISSIQTEITDIKNVSAGGYIVTGSSNPGLVLMRLDANANVIWSNTYHFIGTNSNASEYASKVIATTDGGFVVAGYIYGVDPDGAGAAARQDSANPYCLKVNSAGTLQWAKVICPTTAYINDHVFNDVAEVSDGYIFGGNMSQGQADASGLYGLVAKTDFNGNLKYLEHFGPGGSDAEVTSVTATSGTSVVLGGDDGNNGTAFFINAASSNGALSGGFQYKAPAIFGGELLNFDLTPTNDGFYSMVGMFLNPLSFGSQFNNYLMKVNPTTGAVVWGESYNGGFAALFPQGRQVRDSGYIMVMTNLSTTFGGYTYFVTKTNSAGSTSATACTPSGFNPAKSAYAPSLTVFSPGDTLTGSVTNSFSPTRTSSIPADSIHCLTVICTPPAAPTASASAPTVCSGGPSTINGSGSGTLSVYTSATGGTLLGTVPLVVNPTTTTTYYVEAKTSPGCVSATRTPVTVTVTQPPGAAGPITGLTSVCTGAQAYSIPAVTNATTYTWSVSGGGTVTGGQNTTNVTITWTLAGGPYTVTVSASNNCGTSTATVNVNVAAPLTTISATATSASLCHGSTIQLNGSAPGATTFGWTGPNGFSSTQQNPSIPNATVADSGAYVLTATNTCGSLTATVVVNVDTTLQNISATSSPSDTLCAGGTISLHANGNNVNSWSWTGPGFSSALQNPTIPNATTANSGQYILTATNACGSIKDTLNILVESSTQSLTASSSDANDSVCSGTTVTLLANGTFFSSYHWTGPNGFSSNLQNPVLTNATTAQSGAYTVTGTSACGNLSSTVNIQIDTTIRNLSATSSPADTLCTGATISLHGNGTNVFSWNWTGPNSFSSTLQNPTISNSSAANSGLYILTASNSCGSLRDSVNIFIQSSTLTLQASSSLANDSACTGATVNLFATGSAFNTYSWTGPNGFSSAQQNPVLTNATAAQSGTYTVTGTNSCGNLSSSVVIQIDTLILNLSASSSPNDTVCTGTTITLTGTGANVHNWNWTGPNGFSSALQTVNITNVSQVNSGLYILTASNACGNAADSVYVSVETNLLVLTAASSAANDSACWGATINLFANGGPFDAYSWTGPDGFSSALQNPTISNATTAQSGTYVVQASNACGNHNASVVVSIDTIPQGLSISTSANGNSQCQGQNITVTANASSGGNTWLWSGPNGFTSQLSSFTLQNVQPNQQGNYIVLATNNCGTTSDTVYVTVFATPDSLLVNTSADSLCPGTSITLTARNGLSNILWSTGQVGSLITISQAGTYFYSAHDSNNCVVHSDTINVGNAQAPVLDLFGNNPTSICAGQQTVTLHASSDNSVIVTWNPGGITANSLLVTTAGTYYATAQKGSCYASDSINVALATIPTISFTDTSVKTCCLDYTATPAVSASGATYFWSDSTTGSSNVLTHTGYYTVTVTDKNCTATAYVNFNKSCISALASVTPDSIYVENTAQLNVTTLSSGPYIYQWQPADSVPLSTISNPMVSPKQTITYTVYVTDTISGCVDTSSVEVIVLYNNYFGVPNVFTPNGDGVNDTWYIITQGGFVTVQEIRISDRWGDPVFDSQRDGTIEWNGKYRGKLQPMGNYVYTVKLKVNATGEEKFIKGNLSLIW